MPGMIEHLYFCQSVYEDLAGHSKTKLLKNGNIKFMGERGRILDREKFMLGGILPDMAKEHNFSHFKVEAGRVRRLYVPDLYSAGRAMKTMTDWSLEMGIYAHLYLDRNFILRFLIPRFEWDLKKRGEVVSKETGEIFTTQKFFSGEGLYGAYGELNFAIIKDELLDVPAIEKMSDELPKTGMSNFDEIVDEPWKEQFKRYTGHLSPRTDQIFSVNEYLDFSRGLTKNLVAEMLYAE